MWSQKNPLLIVTQNIVEVYSVDLLFANVYSEAISFDRCGALKLSRETLLVDELYTVDLSLSKRSRTVLHFMCSVRSKYECLEAESAQIGFNKPKNYANNIRSTLHSLL